MARSEVIPFGKYKGQPVEVLMHDREYCDWLMEQDWFRVKFQPIHTLIVNNFGEPSETPEHNQLQALFTDEDFRRRFVWHVKNAPIASHFVRDRKSCLAECGEKLSGLQEGLERHRESYSKYQYDWELTYIREKEADIAKLKNRIEAIEAMPAPDIQNISTEAQFEVDGIDVKLFWNLSGCPGGTLSRVISIECKPSLGDEYPAVLRQILAIEDYGVHTRLLLVGDVGFTATGATLEQVKAIFKSRDVLIVFLADLL